MLAAGLGRRLGSASGGRNPAKVPHACKGQAAWVEGQEKARDMSASNRMATKPRKAAPGRSDVKARLAEFDRAALLGLVQDLYAASRDNQAFLHARFGLGGDVLDPYKATIDRWLWPEVCKNQDVSVSKAKMAIADYKKASGRPEGLAELMIESGGEKIPSVTGRWLSTPMSADPAAGVLLLSGVGAGPPPDGV